MGSIGRPPPADRGFMVVNSHHFLRLKRSKVSVDLRSVDRCQGRHHHAVIKGPGRGYLKGKMEERTTLPSSSSSSSLASRTVQGYESHPRASTKSATISKSLRSARFFVACLLVDHRDITQQIKKRKCLWIYYFRTCWGSEGVPDFWDRGSD